MLQLLEKQIALKPTGRSAGELTDARDKLLLLARLATHAKWGELLFDWEDQYIHLEVGPGTLRAAYSKNDEFQFGKLLVQMAGVTQEEIDEAYTKMNQESKPDPRQPEALAQQPPPSQRIGSLLVGAHLISPHMIGTVLRTQVLERTLRILALKKVSYTYEVKPEAKNNTTDESVLYPYLDPTVRLDELLFHALMWRTQIKVVDSLLDVFTPHQPLIQLDAKFQFPERLAVVCRMSLKEVEQAFLGPMRGKSTTLQDWLALSQKQRAFTLRFVSAFLLTHASLWKTQASS